jgi:hypothetical protein
LKCASEFANNHSLAALFGAQNTTFGKILGGNTIGGAVDLGLAVTSNESSDSVTSIGENIIPGGARLGFPGGGPGSKGAVGIAQDALLETSFDASIGAGGELTQLGLSAGEVTFSSGLTGAEFATGVGEAKLLFDLAVFGAGLAKCSR